MSRLVPPPRHFHLQMQRALPWESCCPPKADTTVAPGRGSAGTWEGALHESPASSPMRAAAVGLLELIRTGGLISTEWRCWVACDALPAVVREVNECRFFVFFLASGCLGAALLGAAAGAPSAAPTPPAGGWSHSISCLAAELNCKPAEDTRRSDDRDSRHPCI